jgi:hypothetical protein
MSACSQCGTVVKPGDKYCNVCGTPIRPPSAAPQASGYGPPAGPPPSFAPPPPVAPAAYGASPPQAPARCQLGHDIPPGASYCSQGHPIALEQIHFANDGYGGYGAPQAAAPHAPPPPAPQYANAGPVAYSPPPQAAYAAAYAAPPPPPPALGGYPPQASAYAPAPPPPPAPYGGYGAEPAREATPPQVLRGFLVAYGSNPSGDFWPLIAGRLTVGRYGSGDGLDIPLQDPTISSRHGVLVVDGATGAIAIEDTGSTNGTFVNDEHIGYGGRRDLRDGDRIRFGGFTTVVKVIGRV